MNQVDDLLFDPHLAERDVFQSSAPQPNSDSAPTLIRPCRGPSSVAPRMSTDIRPSATTMPTSCTAGWSWPPPGQSPEGVWRADRPASRSTSTKCRTRPAVPRDPTFARGEQRETTMRCSSSGPDPGGGVRWPVAGSARRRGHCAIDMPDADPVEHARYVHRHKHASRSTSATERD